MKTKQETKHTMGPLLFKGGNNGAFMGEAVVCRAFADEANEVIRAAIHAAKGGES